MEYQNGQYYVWSVSATAQAALDYVNIGSGWLPMIQPPNKVVIEKWVPSIMIRLDGKACFPRIPDRLLDGLGITEEQKQQFFDVFNPTIELYQNTWFEGE